MHPTPTYVTVEASTTVVLDDAGRITELRINLDSVNAVEAFDADWSPIALADLETKINAQGIPADLVTVEITPKTYGLFPTDPTP